ncbi:MAG: hypothetical protein FJX77_02005 [Armatimonadetes bacterium]|nr:hypothetical protein [Armatimonadota bacterium]
MRTIRGFLIAALLTAAPALAQKSEPEHVYLFPAGAQRGTRVTAALQGENVTALCDLHLAPGRGVTAPAQARNRRVMLTVAPDAPLGPVPFRIATAQGGTGSRAFVVGDLPEVLEQPGEEPQRVSLPVTVNGRCNPDGDVDRYEVALRAGQSFSAEVMAARLGGPIDTNVFTGQFGNPPSDPTCSLLDATLRVIGPDGRVVAQAEDTFGPDPALEVRPSVSGVYRIELHHLAHLGMPQFVYRLSLREEPLPGPAMGSGATEAEPNDTRESALALPEAGGAIGRFATPGDVDSYRVQLRKGENTRIEVFAARLGSPADAALALLGPDGAVLANADDGAEGSRDPVLWYTPSADGEFVVQVRDAGLSRLGERLLYRLETVPQPPDFRLETKREFLDLAPGGSSDLEVTVQRVGGFTGKVTVTAEGLPEGVSAKPLELGPGQAAGKLALTSVKEGPSGSAPVRLVGRAELPAGEAVRTARAPVANPAEAALGSSARFAEDVLVTVRFPTPFQVEADDYYLFLNLGMIHQAKIFLKRQPGFTAPIHLTMADRQPRNPYGVRFEPRTITAQDPVVTIPMHLPQGPRGNEIVRVHVKGEAVVQDARGREWHVLHTSQKNTVSRTQAPVLSLAVEPEVVRARRGGEIPVRFSLGRTAASRGAAEIRLEMGPGMRGVSMAPVAVPAGMSEATGMLRLDTQADGGSEHALWFEVTSTRDTGQTIFYRVKAELDLR